MNESTFFNEIINLDNKSIFFIIKESSYDIESNLIKLEFETSTEIKKLKIIKIMEFQITFILISLFIFIIFIFYFKYLK